MAENASTKPRKHIFRWSRLRKIVQAVVLVLFLVILLRTDRSNPVVWAQQVFMRLDPLTGLASLFAGREFLGTSLLAMITLGAAVLTGRSWCGWFCPLGTLLDYFTPKKRKRNTAAGGKLYSIKYILVLVILLAGVLGNLTLLIFDPLTILYRTFTVSILPAVDQAIRAAEWALYPIPWLSAFIANFDTWIRPALLPQLPLYNRFALGFTLLLAAIIGLNLVAPRFWCRYLCPLGGMLGLIGKVSLFKRRVDDTCTSCNRCARACPTGAISADEGFASDPGECTLCMDCFDICPEKSISLKPNLGLDSWKEHNPGRRETLASLGAAVFATALLKNDQREILPHNFLIQPPGGEENDLINKCIRCGLCVQVCPTGGLQPAVDEAGIEGFWTPVLVPRLGMCDYSCNACGHVCPVEAIPPLDLETKRETVIGKAYIDENRCIAWSDHTDCIVCEEMCPLPEKAIFLEATEVTSGVESKATVLLPYVDRQKCIGCGICEYKCPLIGEAAIRVYTSAAIGQR